MSRTSAIGFVVAVAMTGCDDLHFHARCEDNPDRPYCLQEVCEEPTVTFDPIAVAAEDGTVTVTGTAWAGSVPPLGVRVAGEDATITADSATWTVTVPAERLVGLLDEDASDCSDDTGLPGRGQLTLPVEARRPCGDLAWVEACSTADGTCPTLCWSAPVEEAEEEEVKEEAPEQEQPDTGSSTL